MTNHFWREVRIFMRFILRRDRIRLPVWIISIAGLVVISAASLPGVYQNAEQRQARAELMNNPAIQALFGPGIGLDNYTIGAMMTQEMMTVTAIAVAIMSILLVIRHTRADEAEGRLELMNAYTGSRQSVLVATVLIVSAGNIVLGTTIAVGLGALHIESMSWASSWLFGGALAAVGIAFTGITAIAAQLTQHSRGAAGLAGLAIGGTYALRAVGDVNGSILSWLSPFGWALKTQAYVHDTWTPLLLAVVAGSFCTLIAVTLSRQRDYGAGVFKPRTGKAQASRWLRSPQALVFKLQRANLLVWIISMFFFGALYGTLTSEVESFIAELEIFSLASSDSMLESFLGMIIAVFAVMAMVFAVISVSRVKTEENTGRSEMILATPTSAGRWTLHHAVFALGGSTLVILGAVSGLAATAAVTTGDTGLFLRLLSAGLVYVPLLILTIGLAVALFGLTARALHMTWLLVVYCSIVWMFGIFLRFPDWVINLSPLSHIPILPADELQLTPLITITLIGFAALAFGTYRVRRRDLATA